MIGIARRICLRDMATERLAQHDGLLYANRIAETFNVGGPLGQRPLRRIAAGRSSIAAMVYPYQLIVFGQRQQFGLDTHVVKTRTTVQDQQGRDPDGLASYGPGFRAGDIKIQARAIDIHVHANPSSFLTCNALLRKLQPSREGASA